MLLVGLPTALDKLLIPLLHSGKEQKVCVKLFKMPKFHVILTEMCKWNNFIAYTNYVKNIKSPYLVSHGCILQLLATE